MGESAEEREKECSRQREEIEQPAERQQGGTAPEPVWETHASPPLWKVES